MVTIPCSPIFPLRSLLSKKWRRPILKIPTYETRPLKRTFTVIVLTSILKHLYTNNYKGNAIFEHKTMLFSDP